MIDEKKLEISKKNEQRNILREKSARIEMKVEAMRKYETYLERVKECNDEYSELSDILARHETLEKSNKKLKEDQDQKDKELEGLKTLV